MVVSSFCRILSYYCSVFIFSICYVILCQVVFLMYQYVVIRSFFVRCHDGWHCIACVSSDNVRDRENLFSELKGRDGVSVFFQYQFLLISKNRNTRTKISVLFHVLVLCVEKKSTSTSIEMPLHEITYPNIGGGRRCQNYIIDESWTVGRRNYCCFLLG